MAPIRSFKRYTTTFYLSIFLLITLPSFAWSIPTTYQITSGGDGTFTLDDVVATATSFTAWDLTFGGDQFLTLTDSASNSLSQTLFVILQTTNTDGVPLELTLSRNAFDYTAVTQPPEVILPLEYQGTFETVQPAPIPEPTTLMLLSTGLLGLAGYRWSQRRRERAQVG